MWEDLKERIAVASEGAGGLKGEISPVYGKCAAFTIIDIENGEIKSVRVETNQYATRTYGSGPLVSEMLRKLNVNTVIAGEFGPGALSTLKEGGMETVLKPPKTKIEDAIQEYLKKNTSA